MANQPIDLPPCVNLKLLFTSNNNNHVDDNDMVEQSVYTSITPLDYEASLPFGNVSYLIEGNTTFSSLPISIYANASNNMGNGAKNLHPIDSLITHPGYLTLTTGSILGNLAMICVILCLPQFRRPANYLIVNLSLSSILFIVSANLRLAENVYDLWSYSTFRCCLLAVIHRIPVACVALTTMVISLDRGRVARNPMNSSTVISPAWKIIFIWSFSVLIVMPLAFTRVHDECIPAAYKCAKVFLFGQPSFSMAYGIAYMLSVHVIPAAILLHESVKTQKIMRFLQLTSASNPQVDRVSTPCSTGIFDNRLRLLRNSRWFTIHFLICWLPYGIFQFPLDLPKQILPEVLEIYVRFYFRFVRNICYVQIALNPVILFALSCDLRLYLSRRGAMQCGWGWGSRMCSSRNNRQHQHRNQILRIRQQIP